MDRGQSLAELVTKLAKLPLANHPGEVWEYSMSVDVLGVIEVVSEMELDRFIAERITKRLGMTSTDFYVHEARHRPSCPGAARRRRGKPPALPDVTQKPRWLSGGGGMVSSAADYLRFSAMPTE